MPAATPAPNPHGLDPEFLELSRQVRARIREVKEAPPTSKLGRIRERAKKRLSESPFPAATVEPEVPSADEGVETLPPGYSI